MYARMTFVLGHELVHMAEDDYWHFKTFMALDVSHNKSFQIYQNVLYRIKKHLALNYNPLEDFEQLGGVA